ncbi:hypothetical protein MNBD_BACTEROID05-704, partial [hydrothermal vent metagenome]
QLRRWFTLIRGLLDQNQIRQLENLRRKKPLQTYPLLPWRKERSQFTAMAFSLGINSEKKPFTNSSSPIGKGLNTRQKKSFAKLQKSFRSGITPENLSRAEDVFKDLYAYGNKKEIEQGVNIIDYIFSMAGQKLTNEYLFSILSYQGQLLFKLGRDDQVMISLDQMQKIITQLEYHSGSQRVELMRILIVDLYLEINQGFYDQEKDMLAKKLNKLVLEQLSYLADVLDSNKENVGVLWSRQSKVVFSQSRFNSEQRRLVDAHLDIKKAISYDPHNLKYKEVSQLFAKKIANVENQELAFDELLRRLESFNDPVKFKNIREISHQVKVNKLFQQFEILILESMVKLDDVYLNNERILRLLAVIHERFKAAERRIEKERYKRKIIELSNLLKAAEMQADITFIEQQISFVDPDDEYGEFYNDKKVRSLLMALEREYYLKRKEIVSDYNGASSPIRQQEKLVLKGRKINSDRYGLFRILKMVPVTVYKESSSPIETKRRFVGALRRGVTFKENPFDINQDFGLLDEDFGFGAAADGMGDLSLEDSDFASFIGVLGIYRLLKAKYEQVKLRKFNINEYIRVFEQAVLEMNNIIHLYNEEVSDPKDQLKTTLSAYWIVEDETRKRWLIAANIGDSRIYLRRANGKVTQISRDDNVIRLDGLMDPDKLSDYLGRRKRDSLGKHQLIVRQIYSHNMVFALTDGVYKALEYEQKTVEDFGQRHESSRVLVDVLMKEAQKSVRSPQTMEEKIKRKGDHATAIALSVNPSVMTYVGVDGVFERYVKKQFSEKDFDQLSSRNTISDLEITSKSRRVFIGGRDRFAVDIKGLTERVDGRLIINITGLKHNFDINRIIITRYTVVGDDGKETQRKLSLYYSLDVENLHNPLDASDISWEVDSSRLLDSFDKWSKVKGSPNISDLYRENYIVMTKISPEGKLWLGEYLGRYLGFGNMSVAVMTIGGVRKYVKLFKSVEERTYQYVIERNSKEKSFKAQFKIIQEEIEKIQRLGMGAKELEYIVNVLLMDSETTVEQIKEVMDFSDERMARELWVA